MRLLESIGWKEYPFGGEESPSPGDVAIAFETAVSKQVKEIELNEDELLSLIRAFSAQFPANAHIAKGDFYFWGVHITKI